MICLKNFVIIIYLKKKKVRVGTVSVSVSQALFCDTCRVAQKVQKSGITIHT